jgi:membrane protein required for beta-lactamase induction
MVGRRKMKNVLLIAVSILIVWMVWNLLKGVLFGLFGMALQIVMIGLFCWAVYMVYKAMTREKIR